MGGIYFFFGTEMGLALRASGKNKQMAKANGINVKLMTIIGLAISSLLVALSATLYAQKNLTGSPQDGQGMIVLGLSTLFLGEAIIPHATHPSDDLAKNEEVGRGFIEAASTFKEQSFRT